MFNLTRYGVYGDVSGKDRLYVSNSGYTYNLVELDMETYAVTNSIDTYSSLGGINDISGTKGRLYAIATNGSICELDPDTLAVLDTVSLSINYCALAATRSRLFEVSTSYESPWVYIYERDLDTLAIIGNGNFSTYEDSPEGYGYIEDAIVSSAAMVADDTLLIALVLYDFDGDSVKAFYEVSILPSLASLSVSEITFDELAYVTESLDRTRNVMYAVESSSNLGPAKIHVFDPSTYSFVQQVYAPPTSTGTAAYVKVACVKR